VRVGKGRSPWGRPQCVWGKKWLKRVMGHLRIYWWWPDICPSHFLFASGLSELQGTTELSHVISVIAMWRGNPTLSPETKENYSSYQNGNLFYLALASLFWFHASSCFQKSFQFFSDWSAAACVVQLCSALSFISSLSVFTHPMSCSVIKTNASGHYTFLTCDSHLLYTYKV